MWVTWSKCDGLEVKTLGSSLGSTLNYLRHTGQFKFYLWIWVCKSVKWARWVGWPPSIFASYGCPEGALYPARAGRGRAGLGEQRAGSRAHCKAPEQGPTLEKGAVLESKGRGFALTCRLLTPQSAKSIPRPPLTANRSSSAPRAGPAQSSQPWPAAHRNILQTWTRWEPILNHRRKRKRQHSGAPPPDSPPRQPGKCSLLFIKHASGHVTDAPIGVSLTDELDFGQWEVGFVFLGVWWQPWRHPWGTAFLVSERYP